MKIQCSCGAKYAFEVTPEQARQPVTFVCPACGLDASEYVTNLVRQEFGLVGTAPAVAPASEISLPPVPATVPAAVATSPPIPVQVRLRRGDSAAVEQTEAAVAEQFCPKHPGVRTTEHCLVCQKSICPKCMELMGYVCSPLCRQKAELKGIAIPVFAGQKSVREARKWRAVGWLATGVGVTVLAVLAVWFWYAWFGSVPHVAFAVRFEKPAYSGASFLCGSDQFVFLHGGTLARHDLKQKQAIWSVELIDQQAIKRQVEQTLKTLHAAQVRLNDTNPDADPIKIPSSEKLAKLAEQAAVASLALRVVGQNIWVGSPGKLTQYDWDTGKAGKEVALGKGFSGVVQRGDDLLLMDNQPGKEVITHLSLATGAVREEEILSAEKTSRPGGAGQIAFAATGGSAAQTAPLAGLPVGAAGQGGNRPLDRGKVEEQASLLSLPAQIALPAVLSANRNQERTLAELNGTGNRKPATAEAAGVVADQLALIPTHDGYVQFSSRLIEQRLVAHQVLKDRPKKSALEGTVNRAATTAIANEILNDMQRDRGAATELAGESRYQVTVRRADGKAPAEWTAEVIGRPSLFPLQSVNVVTANRKIIVLDQHNQKLWESPLTYNVVGGTEHDDVTTGGAGPCVERGDTLYVFDQGVLSAFDLKTGNARWRFPSVGISSLFFDEAGMLYVNSTTAGPESIKYSRQIDLAAGTRGVLLKLDPSSGKLLWWRETRGPLDYLSGPFLYTVQAYRSDEDAEDGSPYLVQTGLETQPFVRLQRLDPRNGKTLWEHFQERAPLAVKFERNTIQLVFKQEVQVLKFLAW